MFACRGLRVNLIAGKESEGPGLGWTAPHLDGQKQPAGEGERQPHVLL